MYLDRANEVHVNLAFGRLCAISCRECSATMRGGSVPTAMRGNLAPEAIGQKVRSMGAHLAPLLHGRSLVISAMNNGDPLTRRLPELIKTVHHIQQACADGQVWLDRVNLSSSLIARKSDLIIELADRYHAVFGSRLVQLQGSLLATNVKRNIFTGDGSQLEAIAEALAYYRQAMLVATGHGDVWINYVAVQRGDFGHADGVDQLDSIARVAETVLRVAPQVKLKITRGTVDGLDGRLPLDDDGYERFVDAAIARWGAQLAIYSPDRSRLPAVNHRCGRLRFACSLVSSAGTTYLGMLQAV